MESSIKRIGKTALSVILLAAIVFAAIVEFLTLTEFRPEKSETIAVGPVSGDAIQQGDTLRIMTWNCGYGALGDNADFFMDGGNGVYTADRERIERNLGEISAQTARRAARPVRTFRSTTRSTRTTRTTASAAARPAVRSSNAKGRTRGSSSTSRTSSPQSLKARRLTRASR